MTGNRSAFPEVH